MLDENKDTELVDKEPFEKKGLFHIGKSNDKKSEKPKKLKKEKSIIYPDLILYGYQEGTSLSDLKVYLKSKAEEAGGGDKSFYNVIKTKEGFYWEIHDSGSGKGTLKSVLQKLETEKNVIVKTSRKWVRISKKRHGNGISSFLLNEDEEQVSTEGVYYQDAMKSLSSKGNGLLFFGIVMASLGIVSLFGAVIFKYSILDQYKESNLKSISAELPYTQKSDIEKLLSKRDGTYIKSLIYIKPKSSSLEGTYTLNTDKEVIKSKEEEMTEKELKDLKDLEDMVKNDSALVGVK